MKCARCNERDAETTTTGLQMFYCPECSAEINRMNMKRQMDRLSSGDASAGGGKIAPSQAKESAMQYMTADQVKQYVATWLRYVSIQPMSQPRFFKKMRATLTLPAPQTKGDNHGKV